ncbi:unnamed protein product [Mytilus coruscus]|uniref:Uncharacterized protein n=1 Tax=Mytilus coruscus TaxID=42192 RepID=A0A6J8DD58_MYTCO|nr:unnamed protein product [Mytilus coruscus]
MDNTVESLLIKRYGLRAAFGRVPSLFTKNLKSLERLADQGQIAARMGFITTCYLQASGNLLDDLQSDTPNLDSAIQKVRDIFALSTKSLDQTARTGVFHHMIRRRATMDDTGLNELRDYANTIVTLPLIADGIFGSQFDAKMKEKTDRNKQLAELGKRIPTATITSESTFVKKPKFDRNFKIPKKNFGEFKSSGKQTPANKPWESITDDQWVLTTLQEGLKLEFQETPHLTGIKHISVNLHNFLEEVEDLIEKNAVEIVPQAAIHQVHVAKKTLVHRAFSKISSKSNKTTNKAKSTVSTKNNHLPCKSRSVQADSVAALHKKFRNKGFSRETRKLFRASWRSSTKQDYACKFKIFHSWCSEREKDPYAAT